MTKQIPQVSWRFSHLKFSGRRVKPGMLEVMASRLHLSHWGCHLKNQMAHLSRRAAQVRRTRLHLSRSIRHLTKLNWHRKTALFQDSRQDTKVSKTDSHRSRKWPNAGKLKDQGKGRRETGSSGMNGAKAV